jgi:glycogen operon protein
VTGAVASAGALPTRPGTHLPLGASPVSGGVNFSVFAHDAGAAELRLYEHAESPAPFQIVRLSPEQHRVFSFWHVFVENLALGTNYTWRVAKPGQDLETTPELLDPWARAVSASRWDRGASIAGKGMGKSLRAIVVAPPVGERNALPAERELGDVMIYELHVGGFTRHPSAGVRHPGTFAGLIEKIPYLKELGVTHVEMLPVMAFDEQDVPPAVAAKGLRNYWGYNSYAFFAPHPRYCVDPARAPEEFLECVRALHAAGIGVLLDVVFNHTAEGGAGGPVINFKALVGDAFYHHDATDRSVYRDYTGCGNTINCNHPVVTNFIVNCLEYWVETLGVDGFRFDLASVFARGEDGAVLANPPLPWNIELSRTLASHPVIAEAWDAAGLYQVGSFPGMRWAEWNGRYRDVMRRFVRGEPGLISEVATRLAGSHDMYERRTPLHSVNFVTCHDGFTLADLVSHDHKHNAANGEDDRDGSNDNLSWNCGAEGATDDEAIVALRRRQAKNLMAVLLLSQGAPMILAGDEVLRTQHGNNNAYCQDNELSWFDWSLVERERDMLRFTHELIALRKRHPSLRRRHFLSGKAAPGMTEPDVTWHGQRLGEPGWHDPHARLLAFTLAGTQREESALHVVLNMSDEAREVDLPAGTWRRALDTARPFPDTGSPDSTGPAARERLRAEPRSVVVLEALAPALR